MRQALLSPIGNGVAEPRTMYSADKLFLILLGVFCVALVFTLLLNTVLLRFVRTLGMRGQLEGAVRWARTKKPALGGIGFFVVFLGAFAAYGAIFPVAEDLYNHHLLALLAATGMGFLMGLADDAYNTKPLLKSLTQVACGLVLLAGGCSIRFFGEPWIDGLITVFWVVGMMNSINMLDNMDAITGVVSFFILLAVIALQFQQQAVTSLDTVLAIAICGSICGFLFYNWHPSRMYMGDTGSQFLGVFLAYMGIRFLWNAPVVPEGGEAMRGLCLALVVFALPIIDTTTVTINRIAKGGSPFVGGKDHTTHHLSYAGLSDAQVAMALGLVGLISSGLAFAMVRYVPVWEGVHSAGALGYVGILFILLFGLTKRGGEHRSLHP